MKSFEDKIADVHRLISAYGVFMQLPDLALDAEGMVAFSYEDVEITLSLEPGQTDIVLRSMLDFSDLNLDAGFPTHLLAANVYAVRAGLGAVGIDPVRGAWTWIDRVDPVSHDGASLHRRLNAAAEAVRFWRNHVGGLVAAPEAGPSGTDTLHVFRV